MKRLNYCIYFVFLLLRAHADENAGWQCTGNGKTVWVPGDTVTLPGKPFSPPAGCIYKGEGLEMREGDYYFEVKVGNKVGSVKVGVATQDFSRQYVYDDDLSNGCETPIKRHFGDIVHPEYLNPDVVDTVGVIVRIRQKQNAMWIYLVHDGVQLGLAFKITNPPTSLFPAILVSSVATVTITENSFEERTMRDKLERSKDIVNNFYRLTSVKGENGKTVPGCENQRIRLRPYLNQRIKKGINHDSVHVYVILDTHDEKIEGTLHKMNNQWTFFETEENVCLKSVKDVLKNLASLEINNGKITAKSKDRKSSFEGVWSDFPPVNCY